MGHCHDCEDNNIPTVNEEALECCEFISADCVKTSTYNSYFKIGIGKSLTYVIDTIAKYVKKLSEKVDSLYIFDSYVAFLSQSGTNPPVSTIIKNDLSGSIVWTRISAGVYHGTLTGAFASNRVVITLGSFNSSWDAKVKCYKLNNDVIVLKTGDSTDFIDDDVITNLPIDIKIYY
jgi:hypothetical protein